MADRANSIVLEEIDGLARRLKKIEEKLDDLLENGIESNSDSDDLPGWLKLAMNHPAATNVLGVLSDPERIKRIVEKIDKRNE